MRFEWDEAKASANLLRHGIDPADAATSFDDERAMTMSDPDVVGEERFITVAMDVFGRILVTAWTFRGDLIRLISARKASAGERRRYSSWNKG